MDDLNLMWLESCHSLAGLRSCGDDLDLISLDLSHSPTALCRRMDDLNLMWLESSHSLASLRSYVDDLDLISLDLSHSPAALCQPKNDLDLKVQLAHSCDFSHELASFFVLYIS